MYAKSMVRHGSKDLREWDIWTSKLAAAVMKGLKNFPIKPGSKILYLGIASGKTATFFSDIIGKEGVIYGVEISERSIRDLNPVAEKRGNIVPILADARKPEDYEWIEAVDVVYCDVADPQQTEIVIRNAQKFLKPDGWLMIAIKSQSIDVTKDPRRTYEIERKKIEAAGFMIHDFIDLEPFEKGHCFFTAKRL
jgi:fibrillarin-like pre-rRNA processing protein